MLDYLQNDDARFQVDFEHLSNGRTRTDYYFISFGKTVAIRAGQYAIIRNKIYSTPSISSFRQCPAFEFELCVVKPNGCKCHNSWTIQGGLELPYI